MRWKPSIAWQGAVLGLLALVPAWPALHGGFLFDDNVALTDNVLVRATGGLRRIWFSREPADYWPFTGSAFWLEWRLWGPQATGYHAVGAALFVAAVLLLWAVLRRLRIPGAWLGAALFALHPLNVPSVAWIAEQKNLLALVFALLAVLAFPVFDAVETSSVERAVPRALSDAERGRRLSGRGNARFTVCGLSSICFMVAMLSKGSVIILPLVLLGIVWWRRTPTRGDWLRLAPFFVIAAGLGLYEASYSTLNAAVPPHLSFLGRTLRAGAAVVFYGGKVLWPAALSFDYGPWNVELGSARWWLPFLAVLALTALLWVYRRRARPALFAWGFFIVTLAPALGWAPVGFMQYSPVSNVYVQIALAGAAAAGGAIIAGGLRRSPSLAGIGAALLLAWLGTLSVREAADYADAGRLYRRTLELNPGSWLAHTNFGILLSQRGDAAEGAAELQTAAGLRPELPRSHNNLGLAFYQLGRVPEAIAEYRQAIRLDPAYAQAHNNLGAALARSGRLAEAIEQFRRAMELDPTLTDAQANLDRARNL